MLLPAATELIRSGDTHFPFRQDSDFGYVTGLPGARRDRGAGGRRREPVRALRPSARSRAGGLGRDRARASRAPIADYGADVAHPLEDAREGAARVARQGEPGLPAVRRATTRSRVACWRLIRWATRSARAPARGPTVLRDAGEILHELRLDEGAGRDRAPARDDRDRRRGASRGDAHGAARHARVRDRGADRLHLPPPRRIGPGVPVHRRQRRQRHHPALHRERPAARRRRAAAHRRRLRARRLLRRRDAHVPDRRRFTPAQRDLYDAVLAAQLAAIAAARPGATLDAVHVDRRARARRGADRARAARGLGRRGGRAGDVQALLHAPHQPLARPRRARRRAVQDRRHAARARAGHGAHGRAGSLRARPTPTTSRRPTAASASASRTTCWSRRAASRCCRPPCRSRSRRSKPCAPQRRPDRRSRPHGSRHRRSSAHHHALGAQASGLREAGRPGRGRTMPRDRVPGAHRIERAGLAASSSSPMPTSAAVSPTSTARRSSCTRTTPTCGPRSATTICARSRCRASSTRRPISPSTCTRRRCW